jgi:copper homeostasis protein (lipoprotein)
MAGMARRFTPLVALAAALAGCGGDSPAVPEVRTPMPANLAGVYSGQFPCSNCEAIEAGVWLRPDGAFFLRQRFDGAAAGTAADAPQGPSTTYAFGRWSWDEVAADVVLRGPGPERRLIVRDDDHLQLRAASPIEHLLARDAAAPPFADRVTLDGESAVSESGATFKECLTGLTFTVADAGAYRELRRQHRRMNPRGKVALTTLEGHLVATQKESTTSERLVVDRYITMKPGKGC